MAGKVTAQDLRRGLYAKYAEQQGQAVLFEMQARPGEPMLPALRAAQTEQAAAQVRAALKPRRIDALLLRRAARPKLTATAAKAQMAAAARTAGQQPNALFELTDAERERLAADERSALRRQLDVTAVEIKVSRSDLAADVADAHKQAPWRDLADRHVYCMPVGLARAEEIPASSGIILFDPATGSLRSARPAPRSGTPKALPIEFVLDLAYRASRADARARGVDWQGREDGDDGAALRLELAQLRHQVELMQAQQDRAAEDLAAWRQRFAAVERPACSVCGRLVHIGRRRGQLWVHSEVDESACLPLRAAAAGCTLAEALTSSWRVAEVEARYSWEQDSIVP